jgi:hypothetical protein
MAVVRLPNHIVWSTDQIDLSDPFQKRWYIQQVLTHGKAEDLRTLDLEEVRRVFDQITLPMDVRNLWQNFLEMIRAEG